MIVKFFKEKIDVDKFRMNFFAYQLYLHLRKSLFFGGFRFIKIYLYSLYLSFQLFGFSFFPRVFFLKKIFKVTIDKDVDSKVISSVKIPIVFESFNFGENVTCLSFKGGSKLEIKNTFYIGNGCIICLNPDAYMCIEGSSDDKISGITCDSKVLCASDIFIGKETIISWGCYISDTSHHKINGLVQVNPVFIGEHVWISEGVTISGGSHIGSGSIVGSKSYVNDNFPSKSLIVGVPAKVKSVNVSWDR